MLESTRRKFMALGAAVGLVSLTAPATAQLQENPENTDEQQGEQGQEPEQEQEEPERVNPYVDSNGWLHVPPGSLQATTEVNAGMGGIGFNLTFDSEQPNHDQGSANNPDSGLGNQGQGNGLDNARGESPGLDNARGNGGAGGSGRGLSRGNGGGSSDSDSEMGGVGPAGSMNQESTDTESSGSGMGSLSSNESNESSS